MRYLRLLIAGLLFATGAVLAGPFEDGLGAYLRKDYATALRLWRPLAIKGHAGAQSRRGDEALTAGGSWWYGPEQARANGAQWKAASFYAVYIGFRCAYDVSG